MIKITVEEAEEIIAFVKNGYSGVLYGESSMSIYYDGREVLHTGFRTIETKEELMEELENMPKFVAMLEKISEEYRNE